MHLQGGSRRTPIATRNDIVQEQQRSEHTYRVLEASAHHVVLEHERTGLTDEFGRTEFKTLFEGVC
ncbi:hypothetical protein [Halopiger thermotolerans]